MFFMVFSPVSLFGGPSFPALVLVKTRVQDWLRVLTVLWERSQAEIETWRTDPVQKAKRMTGSAMAEEGNKWGVKAELGCEAF